MPEADGKSPAPEELRPKGEEGPAQAAPTTAPATPAKHQHRGTYRPSHKATFIGLAVIIAVLAVNAGIITFVLRWQSSKNAQNLPAAQITLSQDALDRLGVDRNSVSDKGVQLVVNPNARFNGQVQVGGDVSVAGKFTLNSTFAAASADLTSLNAGNTALGQLNVNGDGTISTLNLRKDLNVAGTSRLQGPVTMSQLLTVVNSANISGNLAVGGVLSAGSFQINSLVLTGHISTAGSRPSVVAGAALGSNGTASVSGNDAAGTVAGNAGVGATTGLVACVTFHTAYATIPHVVVSASAPLNVYVSRSAGSFCIYAGSPMSAGNGYAFDYIVEQ